MKSFEKTYKQEIIVDEEKLTKSVERLATIYFYENEEEDWDYDYFLKDYFNADDEIASCVQLQYPNESEEENNNFLTQVWHTLQNEYARPAFEKNMKVYLQTKVTFSSYAPVNENNYIAYFVTAQDETYSSEYDISDDWAKTLKQAEEIAVNMACKTEELDGCCRNFADIFGLRTDGKIEFIKKARRED